MRYFVYDLETTGLRLPKQADINKQPRIIEIGGIVVENKEEVDAYHSLVNPGPNITLSKKVQKITNIKDDMLIDAPIFDDLLDDLRNIFSSVDAVVCHNADFDTNVFKFELQRRDINDFPFPENIICTVQEFKHLWGRRPKLTEFYERFTGEKLIQTHRADDDCRALFKAAKLAGLFDE